MAKVPELDRGSRAISFEKLRTLIAVHEAKSVPAAARALDKDEKVVREHLGALNDYFLAKAGEPLTLPRLKGRDFALTETGTEVVNWASGVLDGLNVTVRNARIRSGKGLKVGTTAFTLPILGSLWPIVTAQVNIQPTFVQIRTSDLELAVNRGRIDLALAGVPLVDDRYDPPAGFFFREWSRDHLKILTNIEPTDLPGEAVHPRDLSRFTVVLPSGGFIAELAKKLQDTNRVTFSRQLLISDVYYGISALRYGLVSGVMLIASSIGEWAVAQKRPAADGVKERTLRVLALDESVSELVFAVGLLGRVADQAHKAGHPISKFIEVFEAKRPKKAAGGIAPASKP